MPFSGLAGLVTIATAGEIPYLLYSGMLMKCTVLAWDGSAWNALGSADFSPMITIEWSGTYFAANNLGAPFLGLPDMANQNKISVLTYSS